MMASKGRTPGARRRERAGAAAPAGTRGEGRDEGLVSTEEVAAVARAVRTVWFTVRNMRAAFQADDAEDQRLDAYCERLARDLVKHGQRFTVGGRTFEPPQRERCSIRAVAAGAVSPADADAAINASIAMEREAATLFREDRFVARRFRKTGAALWRRWESELAPAIALIEKRWPPRELQALFHVVPEGFRCGDASLDSAHAFVAALARAVHVELAVRTERGEPVTGPRGLREAVRAVLVEGGARLNEALSERVLRVLGFEEREALRRAAPADDAHRARRRRGGLKWGELAIGYLTRNQELALGSLVGFCRQLAAAHGANPETVRSNLNRDAEFKERWKEIGAMLRPDRRSVRSTQREGGVWRQRSDATAAEIADDDED